MYYWIIKIDIFISLFNFYYVNEINIIMLIGDKIEKEYIYYYSDVKDTIKANTQTNININEYQRILSKKYFDKKQYKNTKSIQQLFNSDDNISTNTNITITSKSKKYVKK